MSARDSTPRPRPARGGIAITGPCAAGKSTLAAELKRRGYPARQVAQEHSYVPDMWERIARPDFLVFLDASYETCTRRKALDWLRREYDEQQQRLRHARTHCDIYLMTDDLTPESILEAVLRALEDSQHPA